MNVMSVSPPVPAQGPVATEESQEVAENVVDIPQRHEEEAAEEPVEAVAEPSAESPVEPSAESSVESPAESVEEKDEAEKKAAKPKRKSAPRKAAGTKTLIVLRDGRVQYADTETVVVVDLDEAAAPDTDVHDVLDRLTDLRDAAESPAKADAVRALTELIQEKALG